MVFIHGGGLLFGSGNEYTDSFLIDEDIVLVTFNYRLGPLGFLSLDTGEVSGNQGPGLPIRQKLSERLAFC